MARCHRESERERETGLDPGSAVVLLTVGLWTSHTLAQRNLPGRLMGGRRKGRKERKRLTSTGHTQFTLSSGSMALSKELTQIILGVERSTIMCQEIRACQMQQPGLTPAHGGRLLQFQANW